MLPSDDRSLQADFLDARRLNASASNTGGRDLGASAADNVLRRAAPRRQSFGIFDRLIFVGLYRLFPKACDALAIVKPDTIIHWHRAGFRAYWHWKSRRRGGRPTVPPDIRKLIHEMSIANPLWGAPRIHGELLKLGFEIGQTSVAKYMARRRSPPAQGWKTFLQHHADAVTAMDLFVVPTI